MRLCCVRAEGDCSTVAMVLTSCIQSIVTAGVMRFSLGTQADVACVLRRLACTSIHCAAQAADAVKFTLNIAAVL